MLKNNVSTKYLEVNRKENPTDDEARIPSTAYSDKWAANENPDEIFHTGTGIRDTDEYPPLRKVIIPATHQDNNKSESHSIQMKIRESKLQLFNQKWKLMI